MRNELNFNYEDFTTANYDRLLGIAADSFQFVAYDAIDTLLDKRERFVLWRHDVDASPHRARVLAKLENNRGLRCTYFVWLHSTMYHFYEAEILNIFKEIYDMGHDVGLHFDAGFYGYLDETELERKLDWERQILENALGRKITVFSFHDPGFAFPNYSQYPLSDLAELFPHYFRSSISGLINTYGKFFRESVPYCSDANGYWRFKRLEDVLKSSKEETPRLQVLTHPEWWVDTPMSPRDRIQRCIDGRAAKTALKYDNSLKDMGRQNVR